LREVDTIVPWSGGGRHALHWFGLSDGCYCIETSAGRLLAHTEPSDPGLGEPWCEYQVARLFEDLVAALPAIADPVPSDIVDRYLAWTNNPDRLAGAEMEYEASFWWTERSVDLLYLTPPPQLVIWRVDSDVHLKWDAESPWLPRTANLKLNYESLHEAVMSFFEDFLMQMAERVAEIERRGWRREDCELDVPGLVREQRKRVQEAMAALSESRSTDWGFVRQKLDQVGA